MGSSTRPSVAFHPAVLVVVPVGFVAAVLGLASWGGWAGAAGVGIVLAAMLTFTILVDESAPRPAAGTGGRGAAAGHAESPEPGAGTTHDREMTA